MRTAAICPTCATFTNALCVLYDGELLVNSNIDPLDSVTTAIEKLNTALAPPTGIVAPTTNAVYVGQLYVDTDEPALYYAITTGAGAADWVKLANA
jgi:hypothetical protein